MSRRARIVAAIVVFGVLHEVLAGILVVVPNYGISLGMGGGGWFLVLLTSALIWWLWSKGYGLVVIGGIINLADRIRFGYVRDYWQLPWASLYNNLADWLIFLGLILLGLRVWRRRK